MSEIQINNKLTIRQITNRFSSVILLFILLVFFIFTVSQTSSYVEEQKHSANKATEVTSSEIQRILSNKSRQVNAFLNQNIKLITQIVDDPNNEDFILDLNSRLHEYSLDFFATTIAAATGKALIDDFDGLIEDVCISDIKQYEKDGFPNIRIHPNPHEHHYDVIANFSHNGEKYLFLSSFKPDELTSLLRAAQPSFHHLMLVTNNEQPLIELSTSGTRNQMPHRNNYHLDEDETDRILSSTIVPNTAWKVIDLYSPGLLSDFRLKVILQGLFILILIALILLIMRHFIIHSERELEIAKDAAVTANKAKSDFLSSMSHELRTPLNAIVGFGQILELSDLSKRDKESAAHIVKAGRHLTDMINEILDIARIESGHYEHSPEPVLVRDVLLETWGLVQPLADRQNVKLLQEIPKSCHDSVFVDRQRLKQVFLNLMSNAIKYNNAYGHVSLFCSAQPEGMIRISIKDTGPGIEADNLARVFEPFVRLDGNKNNTEGSGIGLALSKLLVEAMGGSLGVDSEPGTGSTFWIEFPLFQDITGIEAAPEAGTVHESTLEIEQLITTTILYIEDDSVNIKLVEAILGEQEGIELVTATEGEPGYDLAVKLLPNLILLDSKLPDIPGYDVLNKLKSHPGTRAIPVIVISADATERQIEKLKSAGAYAYLTKPFNIPELLQTVEAAINDE